MPLFRRNRPESKPLSPSNDEIMATLAAAACLADDEGVIRLTPADWAEIQAAEALAIERGLLQ